MQHRRIAMLELLQKHIRHRDMSELLNKIVKLLSYGYHTDEQMTTMMNYLIQERNAENAMQFILDSAKQSQKYEEALMTIAQSIRQESLQEGIQQGLEKGKLEGRMEGEKQASMKIVRQLLTQGVEREIVKLSTGLTDKDLSQLFVR